MCGIAGILDWSGVPPGVEGVRPMLGPMGHRGPDGRDLWACGPLALGHLRLSILDLEGGAQPMTSSTGHTVVSFNGEIFNHHELREKRAGEYDFTTRSDTEILLALYEAEGPSFVQHLRGFFAFALWDKQQERLLLARDGLGKKPLFFHTRGPRTVFASELAGLIPALPSSPDVDPVAVAQVLHLRCTLGSRTGLEGVEKLMPGEWMTLEKGSTKRGIHWQPDPRGAAPQDISEQDALEEFARRFDTAVARRMEADVPLGLLLSGGLDSTAVLESMARQTGAPVKTFSVGFTRESESEAATARATAEHFGTDHSEQILDEFQVLESTERVLSLLSEPHADPSFLPTTLVCEAARRHVTVALTGDGGDEAFAGYKRYGAFAAWITSPRSPANPNPSLIERSFPPLRLSAWKQARRLRHRRLSPDEYYAELLSTAEPLLVQRLYGPRLSLLKMDATGAPFRPLRDLPDSGAEAIHAAMAVDYAQYLPDLILTKVDRASMSASLELRSPFLDEDLVTWCRTLPVHLKHQGNTTKHLIRKHLGSKVPPTLFTLPKRGFGTPLGRWFRKDLYPLAQDLLPRGRLVQSGLLDGPFVDAVLRAHKARARNLGELLWSLVVLETWIRDI